MVVSFTSHDFQNYCAQEGIRRQYTVPHTPQQNGVAESRTILERARCMTFQAKLGEHMWGDAVIHACYLINRSPNKHLGYNRRSMEKEESGLALGCLVASPMQ